MVVHQLLTNSALNCSVGYGLNSTLGSSRGSQFPQKPLSVSAWLAISPLILNLLTSARKFFLNFMADWHMFMIMQLAGMI